DAERDARERTARDRPGTPGVHPARPRARPRPHPPEAPRGGAAVVGAAPARARGGADGLPHGARDRAGRGQLDLRVPLPPATLPARPPHPHGRLLRVADRAWIIRLAGPTLLDPLLVLF